MTEENQDSPPPKLRLSREPEDAANDSRAKAEKNPEAKPDLKLKRPGGKTEAEGSAPPPDSPPENKGSASRPADDRPFDPENPFAGIEVKQPKEKRQPPELPGKPAPVERDDSERKVEEAIGQIGDEKKRHGILTSIITILILLALLGGSGYGLYYLLSNPAENADAATEPKTDTAAEDGEPKAAEPETDGRLSGPIAKAKAVISKKEDTETNWEEERTPAPVEKTTPEPTADEGNKPGLTKKETPITEAETETEATTPSIDSSQTDSVSEFLRSAHIGGLRTGDRPKLILNGRSYEQGDLVDADTGLRFIGFRDKKLAFRDGQSVVYIKSF